MRSHAPAAFIALGCFWFFGASMALLAGTTLLWPGTALDHVWALNPTAHAQLVPFGRPVGFPFLLVSAALVLTGIGWFTRRRWGWILGVVIVSAQILGNVVSIFLEHAVRGLAGAAIAGALLFYLLRPGVRRVFSTMTG